MTSHEHKLRISKTKRTWAVLILRIEALVQLLNCSYKILSTGLTQRVSMEQLWKLEAPGNGLL